MPRIVSRWSQLAFALFFLSHHTSAQNLCPEYLAMARVLDPNVTVVGSLKSAAKDWWKDLVTGRRQRKFNEGEFLKAQALIAKKLESGEKLTQEEKESLLESRPAATLAVIEALAKHNGDDALGIAETFRSGTKAQKKELLKALNRFDPTKEISEKEAIDFLVRLYFVANNPYPKLPRFLANRLQPNPRAIIEARLKLGFSTPDFLKGMQSLGYIRTPGKIDEANRWLQAHPKTAEAMLTAALNGYGWAKWGIPLHVPRAPHNHSAPLPKNWREDAKKLSPKEFYEKYRPQLEAQRLKVERAKFTYNSFRDALYQAGSGFGIYYVAKHAPYLLDPRFYVFAVQMAFTTDEDAEKYQEEHFNADAVRREQFDSFRESFEETEGPFDVPLPLPRPWEKDYEERLKKCPPQYQKEAAETWQYLLDTADEDLKAQFPQKKKKTPPQKGS